jgi:hypothetical protein
VNRPAKQEKTLDEWIHRHGRSSGSSYEAIAREAAARAFEEVAAETHVALDFERANYSNPAAQAILSAVTNYCRRRAAELRTTQVPAYNDD